MLKAATNPKPSTQEPAKPSRLGFLDKPIRWFVVCALFFGVFLIPVAFTTVLLNQACQYVAINHHFGHAAWMQGFRFAHGGRLLSNGDPIPFGLKGASDAGMFFLSVPTIMYSLLLWFLWSAWLQLWLLGELPKKVEPHPDSSFARPVRKSLRVFIAVQRFVFFAIFYGVALCLARQYRGDAHPLLTTIYPLLSSVLTPMLWAFFVAIALLLIGGPFLFRPFSHRFIKTMFTGALGLIYFFGLTFGSWLW